MHKSAKTVLAFQKCYMPRCHRPRTKKQWPVHHSADWHGHYKALLLDPAELFPCLPNGASQQALRPFRYGTGGEWGKWPQLQTLVRRRLQRHTRKLKVATKTVQAKQGSISFAALWLIGK